jgi:hypothetical protein
MYVTMGKISNLLSDITPMRTHRGFFPENLKVYLDFADVDDYGADLSDYGTNGVVNFTPTKTTATTTDVNGITRSNSISISPGQIVELSQHVQTLTTTSTGGMSVSLWLKVDTTTGIQTLFQFSDARHVSTDMSIYVEDGILSAQLRMDDTMLWRMEGKPLVVNKWTHVLIAFGGGVGATIYINGVKSQNIFVSTFDGNITHDVLANLGYHNGWNRCILGGNINSSGLRYQFDGSLSDVMLFHEHVADNVAARLYADDLGYCVVALMGQSNMVGRGTGVEGIDNNFTNLLGKVFQFPYDINGDATGNVTGSTISSVAMQLDHISFVPGGNGAEGTTSTGLWRTFAEAIVSRVKGKRRILLVPAAQAGTGFILGDWNPGNPIYTAASNSVKQALRTNPLNTLTAVLWHQGESDQSNPNYLANLSDMFDALALKLGIQREALPIVVGGVRSGRYNINYKLQQLVVRHELMGYVSTDDLDMFPDQTHFTAVALRTMGTRYAGSFLKLMATVPISSRVVYVTPTSANQVFYIPTTNANLIGQSIFVSNTHATNAAILKTTVGDNEISSDVTLRPTSIGQFVWNGTSWTLY